MDDTEEKKLPRIFQYEQKFHIVYFRSLIWKWQSCFHIKVNRCFFFKKCFFERQNVANKWERESKTERTSFVCWCTPQKTLPARACSNQNQEPRTISKDPSIWSILCYSSQAHQQGAELETKQPILTITPNRCHFTWQKQTCKVNQENIIVGASAIA